MSQREFQIVHKPSSEAQKVINQWRHEYDIEIISVNLTQAGYIIIALWRTRK